MSWKKKLKAKKILIFDKGYEQGQIDEQVNILVKIRAEIKKESDVKALQLHWGEAMGLNRAIDIIDKYISELRGDTEWIL